MVIIDFSMWSSSCSSTLMSCVMSPQLSELSFCLESRGRKHQSHKYMYHNQHRLNGIFYIMVYNSLYSVYSLSTSAMASICLTSMCRYTQPHTQPHAHTTPHIHTHNHTHTTHLQSHTTTHTPHTYSHTYTQPHTITIYTTHNHTHTVHIQPHIHTTTHIQPHTTTHTPCTYDHTYTHTTTYTHNHTHNHTYAQPHTQPHTHTHARVQVTGGNNFHSLKVLNFYKLNGV